MFRFSTLHNLLLHQWIAFPRLYSRISWLFQHLVLIQVFSGPEKSKDEFQDFQNFSAPVRTLYHSVVHHMWLTTLTIDHISICLTMQHRSLYVTHPTFKGLDVPTREAIITHLRNQKKAFRISLQYTQKAAWNKAYFKQKLRKQKLNILWGLHLRIAMLLSCSLCTV